MNYDHFNETLRSLIFFLSLHRLNFYFDNWKSSSRVLSSTVVPHTFLANSSIYDRSLEIFLKLKIK